ncbi:hypothetical protein TSUD_285090 [Trifolium subterraneum]|uniref:DUF659 domain-containing protein n=1 Tax=Trifolium subterraneum TaxID=3900 RepID=A0A2Z6PE00_TRISU|nr:hypothetical protein TSUD_285090 [Trifolium subterraneum]
MMDDIAEEVGEENVVQIVTDNTRYCKFAGEMLMEKRTSSVPLLEIINERWEKQLHSPLQAAGYFLNPQFHYSPRFIDDVKVQHDLQSCITRMVVDPKARAKIEIQLDDFDKRADLLGQKFVIRVLSLACSSYGSERNESAFEMGILILEGQLSLNVYDNEDIEGLDVVNLDLDNPYLKSLFDVIADLHDE